MVPAYAANMAAAVAKFWPGWNRPISSRWLGDHKTVVGFLLGVTAGILASYLQSRISRLPGGLPSPPWLAVGLAQGVGAMVGDTLKSFFKRQIGIAPGHPWIPADELDFIVGAMVFGWPWLRLRPIEVVLILGFTLVAHIVTNHVAFRIGIRDAKW
jgi:CDP-2,3-bis-(O-geranylgeranyl)-sn-glycerol synthase